MNGNTQKLKELNDKIKSEIEAKWKVKTNANPRIISLFLNIRNPYIIDYADNKQTDLSQDIKTAIKNTNDGVIFNNLKDGEGRCHICSSIWYCTCNNESNIGEDE